MSAVLQRAQTGAIAALRPHLAPGLQKRAMQTTADGQLVQLGRSSIPLSTDSRLQRLTPDNEHMGSVQRLREALDKKGYLYLKQLQPRDKVLEAGRHVLEHLHNMGTVFDPKHPWESGVLAANCGVHCLPFMEGRNDITHSDAVLRVLEGKEIRSFFDAFFGEPSLTFDFKWLRAVHRQAFTGAHTDSVYMSRGSQSLLTCWTPLLDTDLSMGALAILEGSHKMPSYQKLRETYSNIDVEALGLDGTGWFTEDPNELTEQFGGAWKTSDFEAGDVLIFTMHTLHMSSANCTDKVRISCDTRWQPASEAVDSRYVGEIKGHGDAKFGLAKADRAPSGGITMDQLKKDWGFRPWP